jgi:hypothetical protein
LLLLLLLLEVLPLQCCSQLLFVQQLPQPLCCDKGCLAGVKAAV